MSHKLRPLEDQVIVLTGASSGIGLTTARLAAQRGARLVLAARGEAALRELVDEIQSRGGEAIAVVCDVGNFDDVKRLRDAAIERFGGFDTWINDAGLGMFGKILDVPVEDMKKLFDTNVWGVVHGSIVAAEHFKGREDRRFHGSIINLGSIVSYQAIPLQGPYVASKHAVKGFTDSLRMELEHDGLPVNVALIMPAAINTPYAEHAPNYMDVKPTLPPPVYSPETVARALLHAATHRTRDLTVGGAMKPATSLGNVLPRVVDGLMKGLMFSAQRTDEPAGRSRNGLTAPSGELHERSDEERLTMPFSAYTEAKMHPLAATIALAGVGVLLGALGGLASRD